MGNDPHDDVKVRIVPAHHAERGPCRIGLGEHLAADREGGVHRARVLVKGHHVEHIVHAGTGRLQDSTNAGEGVPRLGLRVTRVRHPAVVGHARLA